MFIVFTYTCLFSRRMLGTPNMHVMHCNKRLFVVTYAISDIFHVILPAEIKFDEPL
jgi:hypothetical protein